MPLTEQDSDLWEAITEIVRGTAGGDNSLPLSHASEIAVGLGGCCGRSIID